MRLYQENAETDTTKIQGTCFRVTDTKNINVKGLTFGYKQASSGQVRVVEKIVKEPETEGGKPTYQLRVISDAGFLDGFTKTDPAIFHTWWPEIFYADENGKAKLYAQFNQQDSHSMQRNLDENGNYDYECLEALDIPLLNQNLVDLFDGKEVIIPSYDFNEGVPYFEEKNKMKLDANDILIMEGIHGLNDKLTPLIPNELKFKIYLSALTQLNLDNHNRISTSGNRLIRRIVRDARFRGKSAATTISMWPSVHKGEELHIFPFQNNADAILNTALDYELAVLKIYAEPLLRCVNPTQPEYAEACQLLNFLNNFAPSPPTAVPSRSIIREFIGGSYFHE